MRCACLLACTLILVACEEKQTECRLACPDQLELLLERDSWPEGDYRVEVSFTDAQGQNTRTVECTFTLPSDGYSHCAELEDTRVTLYAGYEAHPQVTLTIGDIPVRVEVTLEDPFGSERTAAKQPVYETRSICDGTQTCTSSRESIDLDR